MQDAAESFLATRAALDLPQPQQRLRVGEVGQHDVRPQGGQLGDRSGARSPPARSGRRRPGRRRGRGACRPRSRPRPGPAATRRPTAGRAPPGRRRRGPARCSRSRRGRARSAGSAGRRRACAGQRPARLPVTTVCRTPAAASRGQQCVTPGRARVCARRSSSRSATRRSSTTRTSAIRSRLRPHRGEQHVRDLGVEAAAVVAPLGRRPDAGHLGNGVEEGPGRHRPRPQQRAVDVPQHRRGAGRPRCLTRHDASLRRARGQLNLQAL